MERSATARGAGQLVNNPPVIKLDLAPKQIDESVSKPSVCEFEFHLDGGRAIVLISGNVDVSAVPRLRECIDILIEQGALHIDVDLRDVSSLDSQGLSLLMQTHRRLEALKGVLRILHPDQMVRGVFRTVGVDRLLEILP